MSFGQFSARFRRSFAASAREQLSRDDVEALRDNQRRVALIINARWLIICVFVAFSLCGACVYLTRLGFRETVSQMVVPVNALIFVIIYNFIFMRINRQLATFSVANIMQLVLDVLVVAVLVYYSGGLDSWFWSVYLLILVAAALMLRQRAEIWVLALFMCLVLMMVEWAEFYRMLGPAGAATHQLTTTFGLDVGGLRWAMLRTLWQMFMILGTALIASNGVAWLVQLVSDRRGSGLTDTRTGLYSRAYFMRCLDIEALRALRDGRPLHLLLIDIDHLDAVNARFGIERGDAAISAVAEVLQRELVRFDHGGPSVNALARISGEEFGLLLVEQTGGSLPEISPRQVIGLGERMREAIGAIDLEGLSITASIGVAALPMDALDADELLQRADESLMAALDGGGNCVCVPPSRTFATGRGIGGL
ncbi:MAG: diguanylate cyclase [Actinomycetes bacterium]|jgi:diguanylate cyclase (GGDEF)-like protein|nr:diguanylate cyclase [Actinomycetes bacterium]